MTKLNGKTAAALASATLLAATGVLSAAPALAQTVDSADGAAVVKQESGAQASGIVSVAKVQGEFSYTQDTLTSNDAISTVFMKAAASLCATAADEVMTQCVAAIEVGGDVANGYTATVDEMAESDGATHFIMGCTCASNGPAGGAIANAEVEGVALASVLAAAL